MLNISRQRISYAVRQKNLEALKTVESYASKRVVVRLITGTLVFVLFALFLPWTQNIQSRGNVTTLRPEQRPQTIQSQISGRIEEWFVREGDFVHKGDTILRISEIKSEYLDPDLLKRTKAQIEAKEMAVRSYEEKVSAYEDQIAALRKVRRLKKMQIENKLKQATLAIQSDSIAYEAAKTGYAIAKRQYERMVKLHKSGLKSLTDVEKRNQAFQKAQAEMIARENKLLTSHNKRMNVETELISVLAQYNEKIAKAESEKFTALSGLYDAQAALNKLQNLYANYARRSEMYYITAPQSGYVTRAIQSGIGETVKEGEQIVSIMPAQYELAIETYIKPIDLPLLEKGQKVRIQFDGWPAIVFSGWPNTSYGTYGGKVFAIDNFTSPNGMYRVLVVQDPEDHPWPEALRIGAGSRTMILLKDVPVWYELWRKVNGFPPDYYKSTADEDDEK